MTSRSTAEKSGVRQSSPYPESSEIGIRERQCAQGPAMHVSSPEFVVGKSGRPHADLRKPSPWTYASTGTYCASFALSALSPYFTLSMPIVASLARATLLEAVRNRLLWLAVVVVVIAVGLAQFLNQVAITESREIQTALRAAALRVAAVFILAVFVITSVVRELGDKGTELLLSLPAPRAAYFFGKFAGHAMVAAILALLSALPLVPFANSQGLVLWTVSLSCELLIMTAMQIIAGAPLQDPTLTDRVVNAVVELIALLLPGLDGMTQTTWLLGPPPGVSTLGPVVGQTAIYLALICSAALVDLYRKNF